MKLFAKQSSSGDGRVFRSGVWSAAIAAAVIVLAVLVLSLIHICSGLLFRCDLLHYIGGNGALQPAK